MTTAQPPLAFPRALSIDLFAGGGGASLGMLRAGREPDIAINHDPTAVAVHRANHPRCRHFTCDVFEVDPLEATGGQPVASLWASPDCRHHSKAAGRAPRSKRVRGLAWVVVKWARAVRPSLIRLENVEEFADWGPLLDDGTPCRVRKGITFRRWVRQLERLGYAVEWRELVAADYGAPTTRKRLYVIARCDGMPIVWPTPRRAAKPTPGRLPWRTAAEIIDWTIPACSIFADKAEARAWAKANDRRGVPKRPLAAATMRRIARGLWRHSLASPNPYIVPATLVETAHADVSPAGVRRWGNGYKGLDEPCGTVQAGGGNFALATASRAPVLIEHANATSLRAFTLDTPLRTLCANVKGGHFAMATAYLEQANGGGANGNPAPARDARAPLSTITTTGSQQQVVTAFLVKAYSHGGQWSAANAPLGAITTKDRMGLVEVVHVPTSIVAAEHRERARQVAHFLRDYLPEHFSGDADLVLIGDCVLVDITLRMLGRRELARGQGFPDSYIIDRGLFETSPGSGVFEWRPISQQASVRLLGNSVCPDVAEALVSTQPPDAWMETEEAA